MNENEQQIQNEIIHSIDEKMQLQDSMDLFKEKLSIYINELISSNFEKLVNILYRLDVSEKKLKELLSVNANEDAGKIIAALIIERQMQKIQLRKQFRSNNDIAEEEKW